MILRRPPSQERPEHDYPSSRSRVTVGVTGRIFTDRRGGSASRSHIVGILCADRKTGPPWRPAADVRARTIVTTGTTVPATSVFLNRFLLNERGGSVPGEAR